MERERIILCGKQLNTCMQGNTDRKCKETLIIFMNEIINVYVIIYCGSKYRDVFGASAVVGYVILLWEHYVFSYFYISSLSVRCLYP